MRRIDGSVMYYTFQHRRTFEGPWLKLDEPMVCVLENNKEWHFSSYDYFSLEGPCDKKVQANLKLPRYCSLTHRVWEVTGSKGYFDLRKARAALRHVRKLDAEGAFDSTDSYRKKHQRVRHEFRLVEVVWTPEEVTPLVIDAPIQRDLAKYVYLPPGSKTKKGDMVATIPPGGWVELSNTDIRPGDVYSGEIQRPKPKPKKRKGKK